MSVSVGLKNNTQRFSMNATESRQSYMTLCSKFTATMDGRAIVARDCFTDGFRELIGVCTRDVFLQIEGRYASNVVGCFCSGDRCNGAGVLAAQVLYLPLFAMAIHIMYKLV